MPSKVVNLTSEQKGLIANVVKSHNKHRRWREAEMKEKIMGDLDYELIEWCDVEVGEYEFDSKVIDCDKYGRNVYEKGSYKFEYYLIGKKYSPFLCVVNMRGENYHLYSDGNGYKHMDGVLFELGEFYIQTCDREYGYGIDEGRYYKQEKEIGELIDEVNEFIRSECGNATCRSE